MGDISPDRRSARPKNRQSIAHVPSSRVAALKDNATTDIAALQAEHDRSQASKKKSRGKSLGPGGLEALAETSANAGKVTAPFQIKSILKPTVPLTPPKAIPTFEELRKRSTGKGKSPARPNGEDLLIDFSTPGPNSHDGGAAPILAANDVLDPFSPIARRSPKRSGVSTESQLHDEDEERKRQEEKKAILERRAARRKSLANRRVSFAPEATLHTWSVMEVPEDSTTSSASNSTRRQSALTGMPSPAQSLASPETSKVASTPAEEIEYPIIKESPAHQRDLHEKKRRRRSSGLEAPLLDASQDDVFSSSPSGDVTTNSSPIRVEEGIESSDDSDTDGDTAMSMDEPTSQTVTSQESGSSTHSSLEARLRQAANQAGTRGIDYDENGDEVSMELATGTVTHAFQPFARNRVIDDHNTAMFDQENLNPFPSAQGPSHTGSLDDDDRDHGQTEDMSMEVTKAVGGILSRQSPKKSVRSSPASRRRSSIRRRRSSGAESAFDETMEFTVMQGGIIDDDADTAGNTTEARFVDEGMTMELTNAFGGIIGLPVSRQFLDSDDNVRNDTMDMTAAVGGILPPIEEQTEPQTDVDEDQTVAMDMTRAVGAILQQSPSRHNTPGRLSKAKAGASGLSYQDHSASITSTTPKSTPKQLYAAPVASETGSPSFALKPRLSGRSQRNSASLLSTTPPSNVKGTTLIKPTAEIQNGTPSKQITPIPARAETPNKTPLSANVTTRGASPKKLFRAEIKARASPGSAKREANMKANALFSHDSQTGQQTPSVILRATRPSLTRRRPSGVGIDKEGVGSPRVSELLDRRSSITESAPEFKPGVVDLSRLRFENPQQIENEIEAERIEEHRRESGRFIMEQELDVPSGENNTLPLKEMIEAMSPKKPKAGKLRGRKSLAVGGARGLLGKRPAELDLDDDDERDCTPKRLRAVSRESSPVKQVHLPKPPSKDETTGRLSANLQRSLHELASTGATTPKIGPSSPTKTVVPSSPSTAGRYKDMDIHGGARPTSFEDKLDNVVGAIDVTTAKMLDQANVDEQKISLQEFLNMTNIHFIELSTTKRRHTIAQSLPADELREGNHVNNLQDTLVAAATTLPLLELYQHATRELKSYISTGRKIVRSIEAETLGEQPPLFREYVEARPDIRLVMDNQFRNGKANARLQSKQGWYQWRAQLVDGLKTGLAGINNKMSEDLDILRHQQQAIDIVVPQLLRQEAELRKNKALMQQSIEELESVDHEILKSTRRQLHSTNEYYLQRAALLSSLQEQMTEKEEALDAAAELKTEMQEQTEEADRVREEHKGWSVDDVVLVKSKVEQVEAATGWRLVTAEEDAEEPNDFGTALTMMYKNELRLFFYPQPFQASLNTARRRSERNSSSMSGPSAPISLTFAPTVEDGTDIAARELPTEKRFFLQLIRSQLHAFSMLPKGSISPKSLLSTVGQGWDLANRVSQELRLLSMAGITTASILGDEKLGVKVMLILPSQGRVDVEFTVSVAILGDGDIVASSAVVANATYGVATEVMTGSKTRKVQQALCKEIESRHLGDGAWVNAVHGFEAWIAAQEKPGQEKRPQKETAPASVPRTSEPRPVQAPAASAPTPAPKRSPLAPKKTNVLQKKGLPVAKQRLEKANFNLSTNSLPPMGHEKENFNPSLSMSKAAELHEHVSKPAITPEMQEAMMHTPIKRVGALRRSPI